MRREGTIPRLVFLSAAAGLVLATALWVFAFMPHRSTLPLPDNDPRWAYAGPFRNVNPAVHYVAEERCADCHADIARSFAAHPMGRSLLPIKQVSVKPQNSGKHNPFEAHGSQFLVWSDQDHVWHKRMRLGPDGRPIAEREWEVQYVLGSGTHGYAYLTSQQGFLYETPISWFTQKQMWDLSPGFDETLLAGRAVVPECLFCHANGAQHVQGSLNHYAEPLFDGYAIGCQRCHGPGELHVASREQAGPVADKIDYTIVNPRHLERSLREAVCEQCHLQGKMRVLRRGRGQYDFRPGLPLDEFVSPFVAAGGATGTSKAVGQVEQMYESRCFQGSSGAEPLGCISCHDPHEDVPASRRVAYYRARCLRCHEQQGCSLPRAERLRRTTQDSCMVCHMPRYSTMDIPHAASTDHRILRFGKPPTSERKPPMLGGGLPIVPFYAVAGGEALQEVDRDRAVALVNLGLLGNETASRVLNQTVPVLDAALQRAPDDVLAAEARGYALALEARQTEALAAFEAVLAQAPEHELSVVGAAKMADALRRLGLARDYWRRAVAMNPQEPSYRRHLALLLVKQADWDEALAQCQEWQHLDPFSVEARATRVWCLLALGNKEEARAEFARIEGLAPSNLHELRIRFEHRLREKG
jgi:hypothetical protein